MKKAKTTKITQMAQKDSYGNTSFIIEMDNGDKGFYTSKNENQTKFVVGQETEYSIEAKEGKKGTYYKITLPQTEQVGGFKGKPVIEPRVQMISFAMAYAKDLVVAGKVDMKALPETFDIIYSEMISKL
jgi:hypothetical protein